MKNQCDVKPAAKKKRIYRHSCHICFQSFPTAKLKDEHLFSVENLEKPKCKICNKTFKRFVSYEYHLRIHYANAPKCNICGLTFASFSSLKTHEAKHTDVRRLECPTCQKRFKTMHTLREHLKIHSGEKNFECDVCGKSFISSGCLKKHLASHTGSNKVTCDICGGNFSKHSLKLHMLKHSNPFHDMHKCDICDKYLTGVHSLKLHMLTHTGHEKSECHICKKLINSYYLTQHIKVVHENGKDYSCDTCGKSFSRSDYLLRHKAMHLEVKPFPCTLCSQTFSRAQYLSSHMEKIHINPKCKAKNGAIKQAATFKDASFISKPLQRRTNPKRNAKTVTEMKGKKYKTNFDDSSSEEISSDSNLSDEDTYSEGSEVEEHE